jgi:hypothetical protein
VSQSVGLEIVQEEYSRFKVWGDQTRASLPPQVHGSLAGVLRTQPQLTSVVVEILSDTVASLQQGSCL